MKNTTRKKRVHVDEPDRLSRFMNNRKSYSEEFKCVALKMHAEGQSVEEVCVFLGISEVTLYNWISEWNKKKKAD